MTVRSGRNFYKLSEEIISVGEETGCNDKNKLKNIAKSVLISKKWQTVVLDILLRAKMREYNLGTHNCCSAAYKAAATLFDGDESKVREKVDPTTFNIYGMGVVWNNYVLANSWYSGVLPSRSSKKAFGVPDDGPRSSSDTGSTTNGEAKGNIMDSEI